MAAAFGNLLTAKIAISIPRNKIKSVEKLTWRVALFIKRRTLAITMNYDYVIKIDPERKYLDEWKSEIEKSISF